MSHGWRSHTWSTRTLCMHTQVKNNKIKRGRLVHSLHHRHLQHKQAEVQPHYPQCLHRRASKSTSLGHHPPNDFFCSRKPIPIQIQQQTNKVLTAMQKPSRRINAKWIPIDKNWRLVQKAGRLYMTDSPCSLCCWNDSNVNYDVKQDFSLGVFLNKIKSLLWAVCLWKFITEPTHAIDWQVSDVLPCEGFCL